MRNTLLLLFLLLLTAFFTFSAPVSDALSIAPPGFYRNLTVGDMGEDVRELQKLLNKNPMTAVSATGAGSPGLETAYFGEKTKQAVVRFQNLYKDQVLVPQGLSFGTGYFGMLSRTQASIILSEKSPAQKTATASGTKKISVKPASLLNTPEGLESYVKELKKRGKGEGTSDDQLSIIEKTVRENAKKNADAAENFLDDFNNTNKNASAGPGSLSVWGKVKGVVTSLTRMLAPEKALATTGIPFGGQIVFVYYCNCSGSWQIHMAPPLPPTFAAVVDYIPGTQAFLSYNLPFALNILGEYVPGSVCTEYHGSSCDPLPTWGVVTPLVGSSI